MKAISSKITRAMNSKREPRWRLETIVRAENGSVQRFLDHVDTYHQARLQEAHVLVQYAKSGHRIEKRADEVGEP